MNKRVVSVILFILVLIMTAGFLGCNKNSVKKNSIEYRKGSLTDTSFESEFLNIKFTLPEDYTMVGEEELDRYMQSYLDSVVKNDRIIDYAKKAVVTECMATNKNREGVLIAVENLMGRKIDIDNYVELSKKQLTDTGLAYTFDEITSLESLAGQEYTVMKAHLKSHGVTLNQDIYIKVNGDKIVQINFSYMTDDELLKLKNNVTSYTKVAVSENNDVVIQDNIDESINDDTSVAELKYNKGIVTDKNFESKYLNLKFDLPENFTMVSEEELDQHVEFTTDPIYSNEENKILDYTKASVVCELMAVNELGSSVIIVVENLYGKDITVEQYVEIAKKQLSGTGYSYTFSNNTMQESLAGNEYTRLEASTDVNGKLIILNMYIQRIGDRMVVLTLSYLKEVDADFQTMKDAFSSYN